MNCSMSLRVSSSMSLPSGAIPPTSGATRGSSDAGQPDPEVEPERLGDLATEVRADALAGDAADHLTDEPAVRRRVVAVLGSRLPRRRLRLERGDHRLPREGVFGTSSRRRPTRARRGATGGTTPGCFPCPLRANSGQYFATGTSRSSLPSCASLCAQIAVTPFVVENTTAIVSSFHGRPVVSSATPPHRSTTFAAAVVRAERRRRPPSRWRSSASKTSRTPSNPGSVNP